MRILEEDMVLIVAIIIQLMEKFVSLVELEEAVLIVMEPIIKVEVVLLV